MEGRGVDGMGVFYRSKEEESSEELRRDKGEARRHLWTWKAAAGSLGIERTHPSTCSPPPFLLATLVGVRRRQAVPQALDLLRLHDESAGSGHTPGGLLRPAAMAGAAGGLRCMCKCVCVCVLVVGHCMIRKS